jgi:O-antigen ligase/polysaccharide polymerase Wzy-like membrane protein
MAITAAGDRARSLTAPGGARHRAMAVRGAMWPLAAVAVALGVASAWKGGFTAGSQTAFAGLAAVALAAVLHADEEGALAGLRTGPVLLLLSLAALDLLSSVWSVELGADAVRLGLVVAGYGAIAIACAALARSRSGVMALAVTLGLLAGAEALAGLVAAGVRVEPMAERIEGVWRPGGTFQYPPALALLQIAALPALLRAMNARRVAFAFAAAMGTAAAGAVLVLAGGRLELALGGVLAVAAISAPATTLATTRPRAIAAVAIAAAAAAAARFAAGGYAYPGATGGDAPRLLGLALAVMVPAVAWIALRKRLETRPSASLASNRLPRTRVAAAVLATTAAALALGAGASGKWVEPSSGFAHGRSAQWEAAVDTALDKPVLGSGGGAYAIASRDHQPQPDSLYAHDLALETWAELGPLGLLLVAFLYAAVGRVVWRARRRPEAWLFIPGASTFLIANLVDWPWHLAGAGAVWALCLGALLSSRATGHRQARAPAPGSSR